MKCPSCQKEFFPNFGDVLEGLDDFLARAGANNVQVGIAGKNLFCPHCGVFLWAPIRGDPQIAVVLVH